MTGVDRTRYKRDTNLPLCGGLVTVAEEEDTDCASLDAS